MTVCFQCSQILADGAVVAVQLASVVADPLLTRLDNYGGPTQTMRPFNGSPAIDAGGPPPAGLLTDQRGLPRVLDGTADIRVKIARNLTQARV